MDRIWACPLAMCLSFLPAAGCGAGNTPVPHRAFPQIADGGDPTLQPVRVVTIVAGNDPDAARLFAFGDALVRSQWWKTVGADYALGPAGTSVHLTGTALLGNPAELSDTAIKSYINATINAAPSPPIPDGKSVYVLYLPAGIAISGNRNCGGGYGGFHDVFGTRGDNYAVVQRCPSDQDPFDQITVTGSHEVLESATDTAGHGWGLQPVEPPWTGSVWSQGDNGLIEEVGDLCEGTRVREGTFDYQRIFSNTAAKKGDDPCVPALGVPYYSVTTDRDWYQGTAGTTVTVPIVGWATAATTDWVVFAAVANSSDSTLTFTAEIQRSTTTVIGKTTYQTMNNGRSAQLAVHLPGGAPTGTWVAIDLVSSHVDATHPAPPDNDDDNHLSMAGVYVP